MGWLGFSGVRVYYTQMNCVRIYARKKLFLQHTVKNNFKICYHNIFLLSNQLYNNI